jgi:hypothetical protein
MNSQLFIPDKIRVGFQNRKGTYTNKLAYVIYYDKKGKLRKEKSWQIWRDKKIPDVEYDNEPMDGFVLNKGVGGTRESYGWNPRNEYIRVYDPRDFEFEISVANLLFILRECNCYKGKGLEGKFVYSWSGTELVLLPVCSQEYQKSTKFSDLQDKKVSAKDLVPGVVYLTKKQEELTYLGRFDFYNNGVGDSYWSQKLGKQKGHIFYNGKTFQLLTNMAQLAQVKSEDPVPNLAELVDAFYKSPHGSPIEKLFVKEDKKYNNTGTVNYCYEDKKGYFNKIVYRFWEYGDYWQTNGNYQYFIKNGFLKSQYCYGHSNVAKEEVPSKDTHLYVKFESGGVFKV